MLEVKKYPVQRVQSGQNLESWWGSCERKAEQLGLTVVAEFIEPGRSATEMTKRVAFQQMLESAMRNAVT